MARRQAVTCREFLDLAAAVALDAAGPEDTRRVEQHAADCPICAAWLAELRESVAAMGAFLPHLEPPPELRERVMAAIRREPRPLALLRRALPRRVVGRRLSAAWLAAAASFVLAIIALS